MHSPRRDLPLWRLIGINGLWFGGGAHWNPIYVALLPVGAVVAAGPGAELLVGQATALGGLVALLVPILTGHLSDRTASRFGRRRPWMVGGTLVNLVGLGLLAVAGSPLALVLGYLVVQASNNSAGAAFSAVIPDLVPESQRGRASGMLSAMNQLGTVVGLGAVQLLFNRFGSTAAGLRSGYLAIAVILLSSLVLTLVAMPEEPRNAQPGPGGWPGLRHFLAPLGERDFAWVLATRALVTLGIFSIVPFIGFYFRDVVHRSNFGADSSLWLLAVIGGAILPALVGGQLSDHIGRRKIFVYLSSGIQAAVVLVLVVSLVTSMPLLYGLGVLYGIGFGMYYAVDWALACDVLPGGSAAAGRDMALFHVAFTLPQVLAPAVLGTVLYTLDRGGSTLGFRVIFAAAAASLVLGTVLIYKVKGVR